MAEPSVHRVYNAGRPRFQLRRGEEAISVLDAEKLTPVDILPSFRPGSLIATQTIATIESFGLVVARTPGDPKLPQLLTRNQFKAALRALEHMLGGSP